MKVRMGKFIVLALIALMFASNFIGAIDAKKVIKKPHPKTGVVYLNPDHIWYNYTDKSIYYNAALAYYTDDFRVDLDGDHSTFAFGGSPGWIVGYGDCKSVGAGYYYQGTTWFTWAFTMGKTKIDSGYPWSVRAVKGYTTPVGEWFGFTLTKYNPPTNWIVVIHGSDGTKMLPITKTFYWSIDVGKTWSVFNP